MSEQRKSRSDVLTHEIAERLQKPFGVLDAMDAEITRLLARHSGCLRVEAAPQAAVTFLFGKSLKSLDAARLLAARGYGEDALVVLRSVLEALFSAAYIVAAESEERATNWIAAGYREQVRFLGKFPDRPLPAWVENWDPADADRRAKQWPNIEVRAEQAGLGEVYRKQYGFLCSLTHSDAWSSLTYIDDENDFEVFTQPSMNHIELALVQIGGLFPALTECFCRAVGIVEDEQATLQVLVQLANTIPPSAESIGDR